MEPKNQEVVIARDVFPLVAALSHWSKKEFQNFFESGILHDTLQIVAQDRVINSFSFIKETNQISFSSDAGGITMRQMIKFINMITLEDTVFWDKVVFSLLNLSRTAFWWKTNKLSWQERDAWREEMGLERINFVLRSVGDNPVEVIFKRVKNEEVWTQALDGYRYATLEEITRTKVPNGHGGSTFTNIKDQWCLADGFVHLPTADKYTKECFRNGFIHDASKSSNVLIAIVKI
jgi:hypothetical protein